MTATMDPVAVKGLADWLDGCLRETWEDLLKIDDREIRRRSYAAAGAVLTMRLRDRGAKIEEMAPGMLSVSAHGVSVTGSPYLPLATFRDWIDGARAFLTGALEPETLDF